MAVYSGRGSGNELLALQRLAWSSLVLSLTRRCPLRCSHCITSSGPDAAGPTVTERRASEWAAELPSLARAGLRHLTFTGGEPILAIDAVRVLAEAARPLGIRTAIVTSGAWASTPTVARSVVERAGPIDHWDLGYDEYHESEMRWERIANAVHALDAAGASLSVRVCEGPDLQRTAELIARLETLTGRSRTIIRQRVRALGRAEVASQGGDVPRLQQPCPSSGAFVREDGTAGPCCSGLAYDAIATHPLQYGDVDYDGLLAVWLRWREDQLLRVMRLVGLDVLREWLQDEGVSMSGVAGEGACESCVAMWRRCTPEIAQRMQMRAQDPAVRAKLDELEQHLFGSVV